MKTSKSLRELRGEIEAKQTLGHLIYEEAGKELDFSKVECLGEIDNEAKVERLKALNVELADLKTEYGELMNIARERQKMGEKVEELPKPDPTETKTLGELIMKSEAPKRKGVPVEIEFETKTLFERTAGWAPESVRIPRVIDYPVRPLVVADYLPLIPTAQATIKYMEETTLTNAAAEKAEGVALAESALALTERSRVVEKVGTYIPVTEEQLEDVPAAEAYLNNRLSYMVRQRLDGQILNGNGETPNLLGTLNLPTLQEQALGEDAIPDAVHKAFTKVRVTAFAEPSVLFMHPNDWQQIRLLRTIDGIYIFGSPQEAGRPIIWGVPVVTTTAVAEGTAVCGDYANYSALYLKRGLVIEMSSGYSDYFVKGKFAVKATMRCAVVHYRPTAFCQITGLVAEGS